MGCSNGNKVHEEFLPESYVMNLMGLDPKDPKDQKHLQDLRNQKRMPYCSLSLRCRVYPRRELERWMLGCLKHGKLRALGSETS